MSAPGSGAGTRSGRAPSVAGLERAHRRERFLPYAYERLGLELRVVGGTFDRERPIAGIDAERHLVPLDEPWRHATLELEVHVPRAVLDRVLAPAERPAPSVSLLAIVRCTETRLRRATWVARGALAGPTQRATVTLERDLLAGSAELSVFLVRDGPAPPAAGADFATAAGARLAGARPWELRIDRHRTVAGAHLDVRFRSFREDAALPAAERANLYRLECDAPDPVLWLNADHPRIAAALAHDGPSGRAARLRDVAFDLVAQAVWTQLFVRAALDVIDEGEAVYPWESSVLELLLPELYPGVLDAGSRLARLRQEAEEIPRLVARLDAVLQRRGELARHLEALVEDAG